MYIEAHVVDVWIRIILNFQNQYLKLLDILNRPLFYSGKVIGNKERLDLNWQEHEIQFLPSGFLMLNFKGFVWFFCSFNVTWQFCWEIKDS